MHRYAYDADNRLEAVFTSSDGYIWDQDARYLYYAHGPMARVELGEYKVQGVDYYYTLQGWIKGVNLQGDQDAEATNNVQKYVSKDAFGYALHYYQNDYQSITGNFGWNASSTTDLFNGNIAAMSTTLKTAGEQMMLYRYDQLNRIKTAVSSQNTYQTGYSYDANGNILSLLRNDHNNATIDNLSYTYNTNQNNRLNKLRDNSGNNTGFTSSSTPFSYQYDNIGNLIEDEEKEIDEITWTVYGKVQSVEKNDGTMISYKYDATGNRIYKKVNTTETHYVRDASGNLMATYENKIAKEFVIYGSSRLGIYNGSTSEGKRTLGNKKYELSNHLGNILSVISDNKIGIDNIGNDLVADYYEPYIVSESDYYPFGMQMGSRSFQNQDYLFAFQGQETNEELGTVHYKYREADPESGRFWSVDPLAFEYAYNSPFAFSENRVIDGVELEGREFFGAGFVIQELADGLAELGLPRVAGFVETYGQALIIDPSYTTYKATKSIQEDPSAWNVTKQLDPSGLTSIPDAVETVVKASEGDERAQGQVVGMVVVVAGGAKAVKTVKAGGTKTKAPANKSQTPHGGSSNPKNTKTTQSNSSPNKSLSAEEFEALIKSTGADKVTVYHKGNLVNNSVTSGRAFSTGKDIKSVIALDRSGKVHQFDIPKEVFNKWVKNNQATTKKDLDFATGVYNEEVLFSPEISGELNKYKVK